MSAIATDSSGPELTRLTPLPRVLANVGPVWLAYIGTLAIIGAHVLLRSTWWRYEWGWGWYQFHFSTIILCPFLAGLSCFWGAKWASARTQLIASQRPLVAVTALTSIVFLPAVAAYLTGLAAVSATLALSSGAGPTLHILPTLLPPVLLLFAGCASGMAIGFRFGNRALSPIVAVSMFGILLAGFTIGPARFVKVGGATGTLLGLQTRPLIQIGQVLFYLGLGLLVLVLASRQGPGRWPQPGVIGAVACASALLGFGTLMLGGGQEFQVAQVPLDCDNGAPILCLAPSYNPVRKDVRAAMEPHFAALAAAEIPAPTTLTQLPSDSLPDAAVIDPVSILRAPEYSDGYILSAYIPADCARIIETYRAGRGFGTLADYLQRSYAAPEELDLAPGERAALHEAFIDLTECRE